MNKHDNGGPAFPNVTEGAGSRWSEWDKGMTLRDYFAAKAAQGIWANAEFLKTLPDGSEASLIANVSYEQADAMLKARDAQ